MKMNFNIGDKVKVQNTMLYNDRIGIVIDDNPIEWDFLVELDAVGDEKRINSHRNIGVHADQIVHI